MVTLWAWINAGDPVGLDKRWQLICAVRRGRGEEEEETSGPLLAGCSTAHSPRPLHVGRWLNHD